MRILATEKENMPAMTCESTDNLVGGHERSGEGSEKQTVSQRFLQSRHNRFAVRNHNSLPKRTNHASYSKRDKALKTKPF